MASGQGIVLWLDDKNVTGTVDPLAKMRHIDESKTGQSMQEGDFVMAPIPWEHVHRCVVARVGERGTFLLLAGVYASCSY